MMTTEEEKKWASETAVSTHTEHAGWFVEQYKSSDDPYVSEFIYGRRQMERHFEKCLAKLPENAKILDVGCGTGDQMVGLLERGFDVVGIEPSEGMRREARQKIAPEKITDASVLKLPFPDDTFDMVYAFEVFRYLCHEDNIKGLCEIHRVLKKGGLFFGSFVNRFALDGYYPLVLLRRLRAGLGGGKLAFHTEFDTPASLVRKLDAAWFSDIRTAGAMFAPIRIAYKLGKPQGRAFAKLVNPIDEKISDKRLVKPFSGHLLGMAVK